MSLIVLKLRTARQDLTDAFYYYAREGSLTVARRFLVAAEATFERLARRPGLGTVYQPDDPIYADLRFFPIARFRNYLVFYLPVEGGIQVFRVLHGSRDIHSILAEDFGVESTGDNDDEQ
jgi:toxin ParE1/3/4